MFTFSVLMVENTWNLIKLIKREIIFSDSLDGPESYMTYLFEEQVD